MMIGGAFINNIVGINEDGINKLIIDIYNTLESIHKTFQGIDDIIKRSDECFRLESGDKYREKYNSLVVFIEKIYKDIINYINILNNVKIKYINMNDNISNSFKDKVKDI